MESSTSIRNIREEMFNVKGSDFKQWYESLNENEKNIYKSILEVEDEMPRNNSSQI
jgi:succinate dehydrogenase flavin-adding protein (antitoxin of CptAB toxin-antitoxin module)